MSESDQWILIKYYHETHFLLDTYKEQMFGIVGKFDSFSDIKKRLTLIG